MSSISSMSLTFSNTLVFASKIVRCLGDKWRPSSITVHILSISAKSMLLDRKKGSVFAGIMVHYINQLVTRWIPSDLWFNFLRDFWVFKNAAKLDYFLTIFISCQGWTNIFKFCENQSIDSDYLRFHPLEPWAYHLLWAVQLNQRSWSNLISSYLCS